MVSQDSRPPDPAVKGSKSLPRAWPRGSPLAGSRGVVRTARYSRDAPGRRRHLAALLLLTAANTDRGHYLTILGDCAACHGADFAGGRPIETPFGKILAANITPDRDTGIGALSDDQFVATLQQGRGRHGIHLYPAMPYTYMARTTREDALAIRAWLATVPAVHHKVVENQLPFPLNIRLGMVAWNALFFTPGQFRPDPAHDADWNRGAYLVRGLAHCGMCHTPKNLLGGDRGSAKLQGYALQGWFAPSITADAHQGVGSWSADDIVAYLRTGHNAWAAAAGPMKEEVELSSQYFSAADLHAIAVYLKSQPPPNQPAPAPVAADDRAMKAGGAIYADRCAGCHAPRGEGVPNLFPRLAGAPSVNARKPASIVRVILRGTQSAATIGAPTGPGMPSFAWQFDDAQVAAVATYIRNSWGNAAPAVSADTVAAQRKALARRTNDPD